MKATKKQLISPTITPTQASQQAPQKQNTSPSQQPSHKRTCHNLTTLAGTNTKTAKNIAPSTTTSQKQKTKQVTEAIEKRLKNNKNQLSNMLTNIENQVRSKEQEEEKLRKIWKQEREACYMKQKRVDIIPQENKNIAHCNSNNSNVYSNSNSYHYSQHQQSVPSNNNNNSQQPPLYYKPRDNYTLNYLNDKQFKIEIMSTGIFYPPSCSAYDICYCKANDCVYVYGGICCTTELEQGLTQYFYKYEEGVWKEIKPESLFTPMPRYGHTLTATNDSLLLFGGVSQYKEKLKDRCFYPDVWSFNIYKNNWKVLQFSGAMIKNRKSHAACIYNKYYIIYGGIDDSQEVIADISWTNIEERKSRWRSKKIQPRYNHQICAHQTQQGRDYLFVYGGRNMHSQIIGEFLIYPVYTSQGQLQIKQPIKLAQQQSPSSLEKMKLIPCQFPIMKGLQNGILILGGINKNNQAINQCWFFNVDKMFMEEVSKVNVLISNNSHSTYSNKNNTNNNNLNINSIFLGPLSPLPDKQSEHNQQNQLQKQNPSEIDWKDLRGAKGVSISGKSVYILAGTNSKKYKAIRISLYSPDQEFRFKL